MVQRIVTGGMGIVSFTGGLTCLWIGPELVRFNMYTVSGGVGLILIGAGLLAIAIKNF